MKGVRQIFDQICYLGFLKSQQKLYTNHFSMKRLFTIMILFIILSCTNKPEKAVIDSSKVILSAKILTYNDLNFVEKEQLTYGCYCYSNNWHDGEEFPKEDAFYVNCEINNKLLSQLCESEAFQIEDLMSVNSHMLYGKYHNRWSFIDSLGFKVCETNKFEGHNIISLQRKGEIDKLLIGPLIEKPKAMSIEISDSKYYKDNSDPTYDIK
ncbi:hypothetical protein [Flavobacterium limi]|uniref:Lipoprotein n=1 Tax=Flavobacterium limi TaxID=2045105 RepID=A0ABQ1U1T6_9FLAO|nr:hypothetical protein [Flavobacterium limi]GGF06401.1 hypothetical protein GCM10011518_14660 [Flavobacterium limi]